MARSSPAATTPTFGSRAAIDWKSSERSAAADLSAAVVGGDAGTIRTMNAPHAPFAADPLTIAGRAYRSRLLVGTGKYKDFAQTREAVIASGAEIVTVAIRRTNIGQDPHAPSLLDALPPSEFTYLPNTAGCYSAEEAVRTLRLARELLDGHKLVKLEVLGDKETLFPNVR